MFIKTFEDYYNLKTDFENYLIDLTLIFNPEITEELFQYLLGNKIKEIDKTAFTYNYQGNKSTALYQLTEVTDNNLTELDRYFKELDGTLLCDLVARYLRNHKVFN